MLGLFTEIGYKCEADIKDRLGTAWERAKRVSKFKNTYESIRPLVVLLGLTELVWIAYWLLRADGSTSGYKMTVVAWVGVMLGWLVLVTLTGRRGFFLQHTRRLSNLVGVMIVVAFAVILFGAVPTARDGLVLAAEATTDRELASIHILRLLSIGTIINYAQRELPLHFVIWGSLPDFAFALSAVVVTFLAGSGAPGQGFLLAWHCIGFSLFLGAGVSMFFSVPSPFRIYQGKPDASLVFTFPMLVAPNFTVPLFMLAHVFGLVKQMM